MDVVYPGVSRKDFDAVTKENIRLKEALEHIPPTELGGKEIVIEVQKKLKELERKVNEERENLLKQLQEKEKLLKEIQEKLQALEREKEELSKRITELTTKVMKGNEIQGKIEADLSGTAKKFAEYQKKCAGFFNQVIGLNAKQLESAEEISTLKRLTDNLRAQGSEKEAMIVMIRDQLKTYEDDFRREIEEKNQIKKKFESKEQENERMRRENQSHTATIRDFESEIERMSKLLNEEKKRGRIERMSKLLNEEKIDGRNTSTFQLFGSNTQRNFFQLQKPVQESSETSFSITDKSSLEAKGGEATDASPNREADLLSGQNKKDENVRAQNPEGLKTVISFTASQVEAKNLNFSLTIG